MPEQVRSTTVTVEVDTNKRTERETFTGPNALEGAQEWLDGIGLAEPEDDGLSAAVAALASKVSESPSTTAALILRYPGLAHAIDRVTRFADSPVDVYSFRPANPCGRCGHDRWDHHKLRCEADNGDCECPGGWIAL